MNFPQTIKVYNTAKQCIASYTLSKIKNDAFSLNPVRAFTNKDDEIFGYIIYDEHGWLHAYAMHQTDKSPDNLEHVLIFYAYVGDVDNPEDLEDIVMKYCNDIGLAMYQFGRGPNKHPSIHQKEEMKQIYDLLTSGALDDGHRITSYQMSMLEMAESLASFYLDMTTKLLEVRRQELQQEVKDIEDDVTDL